MPNSRWSCTPSLAYPVTIGYADTCEIDFEFDDFLMVDHIMLCKCSDPAGEKAQRTVLCTAGLLVSRDVSQILALLKVHAVD